MYSKSPNVLKQNMHPTIYGHFSQNRTVIPQRYVLTECLNLGHSSKSLKEITIFKLIFPQKLKHEIHYK
jgi:hypothetical protein